jgi:hypothetical protein
LVVLFATASSLTGFIFSISFLTKLGSKLCGVLPVAASCLAPDYSLPSLGATTFLIWFSL